MTALRNLGPLIFLLFFHAAVAQETGTLPNSGEILEQGAGLHEKGHYKEAIALYRQIPPSDTNYSRVLYELSLSAYLDSDFSDALHYADTGLIRFPEVASDWFMLKAEAMDELGQKDSALAYYNQVTQIAPYNYAGWFNRGVTLFGLKRYSEAESCFQRCVLIYPYHSSAHYFLGKVSMEQGNPVQAMLSFMTSLIINPGGRYARTIARLLSSEANVTDEVSTLVNSAHHTGPSDDFTAEQEIFLSKAALDKQYPLQSDIEDPIVRQMQVILDKTAYRPEDKGFWMQYYVPFFKQVYSGGSFNVMVHEMFGGMEIKAVEDWNKHHSADVKAFIQEAVVYLRKISETEQLIAPSRDTATVKYLFDNDRLQGMGNFIRQGDKTLLTGPWVFFYRSGFLKSKGLLNEASEKEGEWVFYHPNGSVSEISQFRQGGLEGTSTSWFDNGIKAEVTHWIHDTLEGPLESWYYNGLRRLESGFSAGKKSGTERAYSSSGFLASEGTYVNGELDGPYTYYFNNGQPSTVAHYAKGKLDGERRKFSRTGVLLEDAWFTGGAETGEWKTYYASGHIHEDYTYENGVASGIYREYYDNGQLKQTQNYVKGKAEGKESDFTEGGRLYEEDEYEKGKIRSVRFYGPGGQPSQASAIRASGGVLSFYDTLGTMISEGNYSFRGDKEGELTYYFPSGEVRGRAAFKGGLRDGRTVNYFVGGRLSDSTNYRDGNEDGYYAYYFENGQVRQEGWQNAGRRTGPYREYDALGNLTFTSYFLDGERNGYTDFYAPNGRPKFEYRYKTGWAVHFTEWDTAGNVVADMEIPPGDTLFSGRYSKERESGRGRYRNYHLDGAYDNYYFDHSLSAHKFYRQDLKDSVYRGYFLGGRLAVQGSYHLDNQVGTWTYYFENGNTREIQRYKEDNLDGQRVRYNSDGTLLREMNYVNGNLEGAETYYGDSNRVAFILLYHDGSLTGYTYLGRDAKPLPTLALPHGCGRLSARYQNGQKSAEVLFVNGSMDGERTFYFSDGKTQLSGMLTMGKEQGEQRTYFPNGHLASEEADYYDNLHGHCRYYYPNGVLKEDEYYYNGELEGICRYYGADGRLNQTRVYYYGILQTTY